ncbi:MAG: hypothetical protein PHI63_02815 [Patescibacteria group bacterium]|nr:hypothetical protein [Patescibacteria group bacterium]
MARIWETKNFVVVSVEQPHITRTDGGHIVIRPKVAVPDRTKLTPAHAIELMRLTMVAGLAMTRAMNARGVDIGRINYQDNGNWSVFKPKGPVLHIHLYGRAKSAKIQKYGDAAHFPHPETGYYKNYEPLNAGDVSAIADAMRKIFRQAKFSDSAWQIKKRRR